MKPILELCPVCNIGEVEEIWDCPDQPEPELACDNPECPSYGIGIWCYQDESKL